MSGDGAGDLEEAVKGITMRYQINGVADPEVSRVIEAKS